MRDTLRLMADQAKKSDDLTQRMLTVAAQHVERDGLAVSIDSIAMEEVIAEAKVSRATAYRRWSSRQEFIADVLCEVAAHATLIPEAPDEIDALTALATEYLPHLDTAQGRRNLIVEALRQSVTWDIERLLRSRSTRTRLSLAASLDNINFADTRWAVAQTLLEGERTLNQRRGTLYIHLAELASYRVKQGSSVEHLAMLAGLSMNGILVHSIADPGWAHRRDNAARFGSTEERPWSQPETALVTILLNELEPDPSRNSAARTTHRPQSSR